MRQNNSKFISSHEDLEVYQIAFDAAMEEIFELSKNFRPFNRLKRLKFVVRLNGLGV